MNTVSTLASSCLRRGWFFQRSREPLSLAAHHPLFSHQSSHTVGFHPARIPGSTDANCNTATLYQPVPPPSGPCQPFNTRRSSIQGRFSPIRF
jgi:hypothetical protein